MKRSIQERAQKLLKMWEEIPSSEKSQKSKVRYSESSDDDDDGYDENGDNVNYDDDDYDGEDDSI